VATALLHTSAGWLIALAVVAALAILSRTRSLIRDIAPLAFTLLAYREMNLFASLPHDHHLENAWIVWDRQLLAHLRPAIEFLGPPLPFYFELCYLVVYAVSLAALFLVLKYGRREQAGVLWFAYLAGTLGAYALFPYFPSDPPRVVFPGADNPTIVSLTRQLNLAIVGGYGIHSSVFPSAHVSSAFSAAWGLMKTLPHKPWIGRAMAIYAASVAIATVYGRYHYAIDAVAGLAISLLALKTWGRTRRFPVIAIVLRPNKNPRKPETPTKAPPKTWGRTRRFPIIAIVLPTPRTTPSSNKN
jgi:membrane-associated phospholipid phosphatase